MGRAYSSLPIEGEPIARTSHRWITQLKQVLTVLVLVLVGYYYGNLPSLTRMWTIRSEPDFSHLASHCADILPIKSDSFVARQQALAETLYALKASAYIAEPGASAAYYANLSGTAWHLSERPLLLIVTPEVDEDNHVYAQVSILTPSFEATRAKLLSIPSASKVAYPEWPEHVDPYAVALSVINQSNNGPIYVDGASRLFIRDGLQQVVSHSVVQSAPTEIRRLRERKSEEELEIMKCANEVTLLSIRAAREYMYIGIHESEAGALVTKAMSAAGLRGSFALSLFAENAALPHGSGTDKVLGKSDLILIDCGGTLHGYESDVTRTFALDDSDIPFWTLAYWRLVLNAQTVALITAVNGTITAEVDQAARNALGVSAMYFTHRLGHGIGLEGHESPYLTGGSKDVILTGHTFSNEPGIYVEGLLGIRLEDCFYIDTDGQPVYLTAKVGGQAKTPWLL
ncbi:hypothetical protein EUX98_g4549 [Antrodiella citrinella]|uniref:Peptidase M24 domain-containing protein n=1 Tax=Antrodiella citrinella TaxID=2447956 RepID=A0A4S4MW75_9APHY|nr:hypothetical protein EUX98_g4549 [Antrodiella citrinella]